jgi:hypothetical protein
VLRDTKRSQTIVIGIELALNDALRRVVES